MTTEFRSGSAWNGSKIGWFWGGMTVQGILPYYYNLITSKGRAQIVDRCTYYPFLPILPFFVNFLPASVIFARFGHLCQNCNHSLPFLTILNHFLPFFIILANFAIFVGFFAILIELLGTYNTMADTDECIANKTLADLKSAHFTVCQKPWACYKEFYNPLCKALHMRWLGICKHVLLYVHKCFIYLWTCIHIHTFVYTYIFINTSKYILIYICIPPYLYI